MSENVLGFALIAAILPLALWLKRFFTEHDKRSYDLHSDEHEMKESQPEPVKETLIG